VLAREDSYVNLPFMNSICNDDDDDDDDDDDIE